MKGDAREILDIMNVRKKEVFLGRENLDRTVVVCSIRFFFFFFFFFFSFSRFW